MAENNDLQAKLKAGIDAARSGDRPTARRLLQEVIKADPRSELAWMWLASTTDNIDERRACLAKALEINPENARAREALVKLGAESSNTEQDRQRIENLRRLQQTSSTSARPAPPLPAAEPARGGFNFVYIIIAVLVVLGIASAVVFAVVLSQQNTPVEQQQVASSGEPTLTATNIPTERPRETPFGVVVTSIGNVPTLPPTFTPTFTPTPTETALPSATPYPLSAFTMFFTSIAPDGDSPALYRSVGDGSEPQLVGENITDVAIDPTGEKIAFVRNVTYEPDAESDELAIVPEVFVASLNDLENARQITTLRAVGTGSPSWGPDSIQIVFSSNPGDGDAELFVITEDGNNIRQITDNDRDDRQPAWSPNDDIIVYSSDLESLGLAEIYSITPAGENITRLTDDVNSSYEPSWSLDGQFITFASDRSGDSDIYRMEANGDNTVLLTGGDNNAEDRRPTFSTNGENIVFVSNREDELFQIYAVDLRGTQVTRLTSSENDDLNVVYQPELIFRLP